MNEQITVAKRDTIKLKVRLYLVRNLANLKPITNRVVEVPI